MAVKIHSPKTIMAAGNIPKVIEEFVGLANTDTSGISIARMKSPAGWKEPGQRPEFDEYTVVLKGVLRVKTANETFNIRSGEAIMMKAGEWVQYGSPEQGGAEYMAICMPAFSPDSVHRDEE